MQEISDEIVGDVAQLAQNQLPLDSSKFNELLDLCAAACTKRIKNLTTEEEEQRRLQIRKSIEQAFSLRHSRRRGSNGWALYTAYLEVDDQTIQEMLSRKRSRPSLHEHATSTPAYGQLRKETRHALLGKARR